VHFPCIYVQTHFILLIAPALLLLTGCSSLPLQSTQLLSNPPKALSQYKELIRVPFFPQEKYHCGPAALATVLNSAGKKIRPEYLVKSVYTPEKQGSFQIEIIASARMNGRIPYVIDKSMVSLLLEIEHGNPVLVLQNVGLTWIPRWHYAVVIGFDLIKGEIILRSGTESQHIISFDLFERTWRRAKYWAIVVLPPEKLAATAKELPYAKAVNAFEQLQKWQIAERAYQSGIRRWPESKIIRMGLGNSQYALRQTEKAIRSYQTILESDPNYTPALNNLAQVLAENGQPLKARSIVLKAISQGGAHSLTFKQTLHAIEEIISRQKNNVRKLAE
jgi:tetratricopeptide (TPR) repeat protein